MTLKEILQRRLGESERTKKRLEYTMARIQEDLDYTMRALNENRTEIDVLNRELAKL